MNILRTIAYGMAGASLLAGILRMPPREGGPGYFALGIGFLAGFAGMFGGIFYALHAQWAAC